MQNQHHITVGDTLWCDWSGCKAGMDIQAKVGHVTCGHGTLASALRGAKALRGHFKRGRVKVVSGPCPSDIRANSK
jgi:hypothetical protein